MKQKELNLKIDLNLMLMEELAADGEINDEDIRDFVTHIYGTNSTKIEFLGFKCVIGICNMCWLCGADAKTSLDVILCLMQTIGNAISMSKNSCFRCRQIVQLRQHGLKPLDSKLGW